MGYSTHTTVQGMYCDRCEARLSIGVAERKAYDAAAQRQGWTAWASRGLRHYCPECAKSYPRPKSRERMRQIW